VIILGSAKVTANGQTVTIARPPGSEGPNSPYQAVRLTNFTSDVLVLTNIGGTVQSQEYLAPLATMVYHSEPSGPIPTIVGQALGANLPLTAVLVEWSTDPDNDFIGTYPYTNPVLPAASQASAPFFNMGLVTLTTHGDPYEINPNPSRLSLTMVNEGAAVVNVYNNVGLAGHPFPIAPGGSLTLNTTQGVWLSSGTDAQSVSWIATQLDHP
jgi:hypothetical protein